MDADVCSVCYTWHNVTVGFRFWGILLSQGRLCPLKSLLSILVSRDRNTRDGGPCNPFHFWEDTHCWCRWRGYLQPLSNQRLLSLCYLKTIQMNDFFSWMHCFWWETTKTSTAVKLHLMLFSGCLAPSIGCWLNRKQNWRSERNELQNVLSPPVSLTITQKFIDWWSWTKGPFEFSWCSRFWRAFELWLSKVSGFDHKVLWFCITTTIIQCMLCIL